MLNTTAKNACPWWKKIKPAPSGTVSNLPQLHMDKLLGLISLLKPGTMLSYIPTLSWFHQNITVCFFPTLHIQLHVGQLKLLISWNKDLWIHSDFFLTPDKILYLSPSIYYTVNIDFAYWFWYKQEGMNLRFQAPNSKLLDCCILQYGDLIFVTFTKP